MDIFSLTINQDKESMLRTVSNRLVDRGYVKESYPDALIEREKKHPTGLRVEELINIAIPHTDVEHVSEQTLVVIKREDSQFHFQRMDKPAESIPVDAVFLLVVKEADGYVRFLADFTGLFQDEPIIHSLATSNPDQICHLLETVLDTYDLTYKGELAS